MTVPSNQPIRFRCGQCDKAVRAARRLAGRRVICPKCGGRQQVPRPAGGSSAELIPPPAAVGLPGTARLAPAVTETLNLPCAGGSDDGEGLINRVLGADYRLDALLGTGATAQVFVATQMSLRRRVAVKVLPPHNANPRRLERFRREAQTLARLAHPNILRVYAYGCDDGLHWMAVELAARGDLYSARPADRAVRWSDAVGWLRQSLCGLAAVHESGLVHRDVKPHNLMLAADGSVRLADFGLVRLPGDPPGKGKLVGTPAYVSPEQALGKDIDGRADLYSLGATFWHLLAGRMPHSGASVREVVLGHLSRPTPSLRAANPEVPRPLSRIISRLMEKSPSLRYQTAGAALADLDSYGDFGGAEPAALRRGA